MKSYDSRTYSINDFVEWDAAKQLELNPRFQRRSVWTDTAKSYLMDTIIRGKPIPKVFIRQKINVTTKTSMREVVDGQQRLRTILSFIKDGFVISRRHNVTYGNSLFSHLPLDTQAQILSYEVSVDLLINLPDTEVLDIFNRLNSYAVVLNDQEKINAEHFGPFKMLADKIGHKYYDYWISQDILAPRKIVRMQEINLVADILIAIIDGIRSKKQVKKYYNKYESEFPYDVDELENRFDAVVLEIGKIYAEGLSDTQFQRPHLYYSLFTAIAHRLQALPGLPPELGSRPIAPDAARFQLERVDVIFQASDTAEHSVEDRQFLMDSRNATTDEVVRKRRTQFLLGLIL